MLTIARNKGSHSRACPENLCCRVRGDQRQSLCRANQDSRNKPENDTCGVGSSNPQLSFRAKARSAADPEPRSHMRRHLPPPSGGGATRTGVSTHTTQVGDRPLDRDQPPTQVRPLNRQSTLRLPRSGEETIFARPKGSHPRARPEDLGWAGHGTDRQPPRSCNRDSRDKPENDACGRGWIPLNPIARKSQHSQHSQRASPNPHGG